MAADADGFGGHRQLQFHVALTEGIDDIADGVDWTGGNEFAADLHAQLIETATIGIYHLMAIVTLATATSCCCGRFAQSISLVHQEVSNFVVRTPRFWPHRMRQYIQVYRLFLNGYGQSGSCW